MMRPPKRYDLTQANVHVIPGESLKENVLFEEDKICSTFSFSENRVHVDEVSGKVAVWPETQLLQFEVLRKVPRVG